MTAARMSDVLKDVWDSQLLHNQFYGAMLEFKHQDPFEIAWDDAIRWIERKHGLRTEPPGPPIKFNWDWPDPTIPSEERARMAEWEDGESPWDD